MTDSLTFYFSVWNVWTFRCNVWKEGIFFNILFSFSNLSLFQTEKVEQGEVVIRQGDDGDYFYVIQKLVYQFKYDKI